MCTYVGLGLHVRLDGVDSIFREMQAFFGVHTPHVLVRVLDPQRYYLLQKL